MWPKWLTLEFWKGVFTDFMEFMSDLPIKALKGILEAILKVLNAIAPPDFLSQYKLSSVMGAVNADMGYFLMNSGISTALAIIVGAVTFRVMRKIVTFGWW